MTISSIGSPIPIQPPAGGTPPANPLPAGQGQGFGDMISDAVHHLNNLQKGADEAAIGIATGQSSDLHSALVKVEEASLALQLAIQVRNKVLESYQEIMRMQV